VDVTLHQRPVANAGVGQELGHEIEAHEVEATTARNRDASEVPHPAPHVEHGSVDVSEPVEHPIEDAFLPLVEHRAIIDVHGVGVALRLALFRDKQSAVLLIHAPTVSLGVA
jgi:hypothetical protein